MATRMRPAASPNPRKATSSVSKAWIFPLYRLRAQDHRVIFRDLGDSLEITRVRSRREAYR